MPIWGNVKCLKNIIHGHDEPQYNSPSHLIEVAKGEHEEVTHLYRGEDTPPLIYSVQFPLYLAPHLLDVTVGPGDVIL